MIVAVTIGSYLMPDFVRLNVRRCKAVFGPDAPILVSDDCSSGTPAIRNIANEEGVAFWSSTEPMSHFSGDIQAFINAIAFAESNSADVALKLSMRLIPVLPIFRAALEREMTKPETMICTPGRLLVRQLARPKVGFYTKFGLLTDAVAIRCGTITANELRDAYRQANNNAKQHSDSLVELVIGSLITSHPKLKGGHVTIPEWTHFTPGEPMPYLRKSQCGPNHYAKVAALEGITGRWDIREWTEILKGRYRCRAATV